MADGVHSGRVGGGEGGVVFRAAHGGWRMELEVNDGEEGETAHFQVRPYDTLT